MTRARDLSRLANEVTVTDTGLVGVGSTQPKTELNVVGVVSATSFYGDGTNLSNTGSTLSAASGSQRVVLTSLTSGTMTASSTDANVTYNVTTQTLSVPNVSIAGTLTYEDVTNVDSVGLITARNGAIINAGTATTALIVNGNARVTGILTIGTSSVTLDGTNNQVNVGTGVTIHHTNGVQVGNNTLHSTGLTVSNLNSSGIVTTSELRVGTGVTISSGIITASEFRGSGANLTGIVASTASNLNSTGVSTVSTLRFTSAVYTNPLIVPPNSSYTIYISDSGNDTTGNGTNGSPYRSLNKALNALPSILVNQDVNIKILGASYTNSAGVELRGIGGQSTGNYYIGNGINIQSDSGSAITFNTNDYGIEFADISVPIRFRNLNFVIPNTGGYNGFYMERCKYLIMYNSCTWTTGSTYGWSYGGGGRFVDTSIVWDANVTVTSSASAGLGGLFVFDRCQSVSFTGNITKSGTRFGNHAIVVKNGTWLESGSDVTNFNVALSNGNDHYDAECGGMSVLNGFSAINCATGVQLRNGANNKIYSITYSSNGTNISSTNSWNV